MRLERYEEPPVEPAEPRLSRAEIEVVALILAGHSSREAAALLFVSKRTVDFHLRNVYLKLQVRNRLECLRIVTERDLLNRPKPWGKNG